MTSIKLDICSRLSEGVFLYCANLKTVDLPKCNYLSNSVFFSCLNLERVILRESSVCSVAGNPFSNAGTIFSIYVPVSLVDTYKAATYWKNDSIISRIFPIPDDLMFSNGLVYGWAESMNSTYLETLSITSNDVTGVSMVFLTDLASSTFMNHQNLSYVSIPGVTYYGDDTFAGCTSLSEYEIDSNVTSMGDRVFAGCTSLTTVNVNTDAIPIGSDVFSGCTALTSINVPMLYYSNFIYASGWSEYSSLIVSVTPELAFENGMLYGSASFLDISSITNFGVNKNDIVKIYLPNCTELNVRAIYSCKNLTEVYLPECKTIGMNGIAECPVLNSITLTNCEFISDNAFQGTFQSANINVNIDLPVCSFISTHAFYWTIKLGNITLGSNTMCTLGNNGANVFDTAGNDYSIYVPSSLVDTYKSNMFWNWIQSRIFPIPE